MKLRNKFILWVCMGLVFIASLFNFISGAKKHFNEVQWKQVENRQVVKKNKPVRIVIQRNGKWYPGTEQDVYNNQK